MGCPPTVQPWFAALREGAPRPSPSTLASDRARSAGSPRPAPPAAASGLREARPRRLGTWAPQTRRLASSETLAHLSCRSYFCSLSSLPCCAIAVPAQRTEKPREYAASHSLARRRTRRPSATTAFSAPPVGGAAAALRTRHREARQTRIGSCVSLYLPLLWETPLFKSSRLGF